MDDSNRVKRLRREAEELRHRFAQGGNGVFSSVLPSQIVVTAVEDTVGVFRDRQCPPLTTLRLFVEQALSDDPACQDVVGRHLSERVARGAKPLQPQYLGLLPKPKGPGSNIPSHCVIAIPHIGDKGTRR